MSRKDVKLFSSHYILLPDGTLGKWPVLTVDESGLILDVETRESFTERPGMELHPGILIPGLIDLCEEENRINSKPNLNKHFAHGTLLLGSSYEQQDGSLPLLTSSYNVESNSPSFLVRNPEEDSPLLERMKAYHPSHPNTRLEEILYWATSWGAQQTELEKHLGQLQIGYKPGFMVLQQVDLTTMQLTPSVRIKWLSTPSFS